VGLNWVYLGWRFPLRALTTSILMFVTLLVVVRLGGKRTLTKMNVFDFVFSVAIGSTVAATIMSHDVTYVEGAIAVAAFAGMQILAGTVSSRWSRIDTIINGRPSLVMRDGKFLHKCLHREKISQEEVLCALRLHSISRFEEVAAVVVETDGQFSVLRHDDESRAPETLADVDDPSDAGGPLDEDTIEVGRGRRQRRSR
jgi:uncharacterized membrane protein YcaP (DUF421 family)